MLGHDGGEGCVSVSDSDILTSRSLSREVRREHSGGIGDGQTFLGEVINKLGGSDNRVEVSVDLEPSLDEIVLIYDLTRSRLDDIGIVTRVLIEREPLETGLKEADFTSSASTTDSDVGVLVSGTGKLSSVKGVIHTKVKGREPALEAHMKVRDLLNLGVDFVSSHAGKAV